MLDYAEKNHSNADKSFLQLQIEVKTLPENVRAKVEPKVKEYKKKLNAIIKRIGEIKEDLSNIEMKEEAQYNRESGRSAISRIGDTLLNSKDRLLDMTRLANESDDMTKNMNVTLLSDREKLIAVKKANERISGNLSTGSTLINSLRYKQDYEKALLIIISALLLILNLLIFVYKVFF